MPHVWTTLWVAAIRKHGTPFVSVVHDAVSHPGDPTGRLVHWLHDLVGRPYWSLAQHVKARFPGAQRYVERFRAATLVAAREAGVDGVICGHIHKADAVSIDGLMYYNDGDWVESCTVLVENELGELALRAWRPTRAAIAAARTATEPRAAGNAR